MVLIAAAVDNDWILPGHCHGRALSVVDRLLLVNNGCDRILARYHWLYGRRSCAEALGYTGLVGGGQLGAELSKITQFDACCNVGTDHDWALYFGSPAVVGRIVPLLFRTSAVPAQPIAPAQPTTSAPPIARGQSGARRGA